MFFTNPAPRNRRFQFQLSLEQLEARQLLSGFQPTAVEQLFLEQLNDARANPAAYGASIGLDLSNVAPSQPLAFNPLLIQSARQHSQDMNDRGYFDHNTPDGVNPGQRITNAGFTWMSWGESIAAGSAFPDSASALKALIIDAGVPDLGHRNQLLDLQPIFNNQTEVGIGVVQNGSGPLTNYYTIDSAAPTDSRPFITGVVFNDANGNGKYDLGEGLGNVTVTVAGVGSTTTWDSGGYSFQVSPGTYSVTASGGGLAAPITESVTVGATNSRLNFIGSSSSLGSGGGHTASNLAPGTPGIASVSLGSQSAVFAIGPDGGLYRHDPSGWTKLSTTQQFMQISAGTDGQGTADAYGVTSDGALYKYDVTHGLYMADSPGQIQAVNATEDNWAIAVTTDGSIYSYNGLANGQGARFIVEAAGFAQDVSAANDSAGHLNIYAVTPQHTLVEIDSTFKLALLSGGQTITQVSAGQDGKGNTDAYVVTANGALYKFDSLNGFFEVDAPGMVSQVSAAEDDWALAVGTDGRLFSYNGKGQGQGQRFQVQPAGMAVAETADNRNNGQLDVYFLTPTDLVFLVNPDGVTTTAMGGL
ncbi:MAG: hypothetical protein JO112_00030, partial [Planctomycetes bacterium]|nr:hypothetical protein [Planctomycetota bacterium]